MQLKRFSLLFLILIFFGFGASGQSVLIKGIVQNEVDNNPLETVEVRASGQSVYSGRDGTFELNVRSDKNKLKLSFFRYDFDALEMAVEVEGRQQIDLGVIKLKALNDGADLEEDLISVITLTENELEEEGAQNFSSLLTASRDLFANTAAYVFGTARFRTRGYDGENSLLYLNGVPVNDMESGRLYWSTWGGLNDVLRNQESTIGLGAMSYSLGGIGGGSAIDTRASVQRKQFRVSYAISNRSYRNRLMATYSTGMLKSGWAFSLSASRRWADEGYIEGTFYDAYSYFLSADKKVGRSHTFNLTAFGAPIQRGKSGAGTQEMYDLSGSNFYNPNWGYQNGEKRNARVAHYHQPVMIFRHDWSISEKTNLTTAVSYQFGESGGTALDWYEARDPRPDYYRRLPSYIDNSQSDVVASILRASEDARQIDWDYMYNANRFSNATVYNADGIDGNNVTGRRANYIIEDRRYDTKRFNFNTNLETFINDNFSISAGLNYQSQTIHKFKEVEDLLGAEFYVDVDKFAEFDSLPGSDFVQNNLDVPNQLVKEGDRFGYDYENHIRSMGLWAQANVSLNKIDAFAGFKVDNIRYWRHGNVRNGKFPENSAGNSEEMQYTDLGVKAGVNYKIDGRNYLLLNGAYMLRAPFVRNAFVSPRTRDQLVNNLEQEKIMSVEGGYRLNAPYLKARIIGYYTTFQDGLYNRSFYLDNAIITDDGSSGGFVNYIMTGVDKRHFGVELAGEYNISPTFVVNAVAALGKYHYANRPEVSVYLDNVAEELSSRTVYIKNFNVPGTPQNAYTLGLKYNSPKYWFASFNFNYFDNIWMDFYPERRTNDAVSYVSDPQFSEQVVDSDSELWHDIIDQEKVPAAFTLNFFGGKSWKIKDYFIYLNVGVNNILDKKDFITGGYEQFRFDFEGKDVGRFPTRYFYSYGRNYYISLAFRM